MHVVPPPGSVASLQAPPPAKGGAAAVLQAGEQAGRLTFVTHLPGRAGQHADWPSFVPPELTAALAGPASPPRGSIRPQPRTSLPQARA